MHDILIYLLDKESESEVRALFSGEKYNLTIVEDLEQVVEVCQQELFDLLLVWPAGYDKTANLMTLLEVNQFDYIPVIPVLKDDPQPEAFLKLPIVDLLRLPLPKPEFFAIIHQAIKDIDVQASMVEGMNWQGSIEEYSLLDLIQMIENGERDAELILSCENKTGYVYFHKGKLVAAEFQSQRGLEALQKMGFWPKGQFETRLSDQSAVKDEIGSSNQEVLMALLEKMLKLGQLYQGLPELFEEIMKNPLAQPVELTPLQDRIANFCQTPISVFNLLVSLADGSEDILLELKIMMQMGLIGRRQEVEALVREERERSGLSKFFSSISSMFKKKPGMEEVPAYETFEDEFIPPKVEIPILRLSSEDVQKIKTRLEAAAK
ncbi:MAG: DUF4388 domain-containing protein [Calditrichaceae bacterium]|nr:DUF4388 domain-containing protein [Calditrichia bacterium]NUQ43489.1 DUF4388 domain-containing protein [Calditrichaceae bacterium]